MIRNFPPGDTLENAKNVLIERQEGYFSPTAQNCADFPTCKGIYFWYIAPKGLEIIYRSLKISTRLFPEIDKDGYKLIYIGSAGARKTKDNQGHLKQRLEWHIINKHRESAIVNGTLSTLRTTLGSILNEDLIHSDGSETETLINLFMGEHLKVTYIKYNGDLNDVILSINDDEEFLIKTFKPLLNLKNNSNQGIIGHPTNAIRLRRKEIISKTKTRLKCVL